MILIQKTIPRKRVGRVSRVLQPPHSGYVRRFSVTITRQNGITHEIRGDTRVAELSEDLDYYQIVYVTFVDTHAEYDRIDPESV